MVGEDVYDVGLVLYFLVEVFLGVVGLDLVLDLFGEGGEC